MGRNVGSGGGEVSGHRFRPAISDNGARACTGDDVVRDKRGAGLLDDGHRDAGRAIADDVGRGVDVAQIPSPAHVKTDAGDVLDHVSGDSRVGFHRDADAEALHFGRVGPLIDDVADDVARTGRKPPAVQEVRDGNAHRAAVDEIVRNDRTLKRELRVDRGFPGAQA